MTTMAHFRKLLSVGLLIGLGSAWSPTVAYAGDGVAAKAEEGEIRFQFVQLKDGGVIRCALYKTPEDHMKKSFQDVIGSVSGGRAQCVFTHVGPGTYSMAAYHDENNNGKLDTNFFGIPKEGVCASNNAKGTMGPPKYQDASFTFSGSFNQELRMTYR